jgi:hypothetical protein
MTSISNAPASSATTERPRDTGGRLSPMPPIPHRPVSGRYRGRRGDFEVELRVDVDGPRPMNCVSADYFQIQGGQTVYVGSMRVDAPVVVSSRSLLRISGVARASWHPEAANVRVTIPRSLPGAPPTTATLSHLAANGQVQARWECTYESACFRQAILEETIQPGVQHFASYDTGSLPAGCSPRTLTHLSAFQDTGIEMVRTREPDVLKSADLATNVSWSDAELQAAMMQYFSAYADVPQWAIWMLHARLHDNDLGAARPKLYGLMFDRRGKQRQGCAVFYQGMAGTSSQHRRVQLFTCVHELGHGFNLAHSFQKSLAVPPLPSRPGSTTWMAYPYLFPGGEAAFWPKFPFRFDDGELVHLRHAFREEVIMGGDPFLADAAFAQDAMREAVQYEDPGLRLTLTVQSALPYGVPVTVDFELSGTTREGRRAPSCMGPRTGNLDLEIRGPDGTAIVFEPLLRHCVADDGIMLRAGDPPVRDSAFIHYGRNGFAFDRPGRYEIRARCGASDGLFVLSNVVRIDVRPPVTRADHAVADLAFGDEQGALMSLVGSDASQLRRGSEALQMIVERYPNHPVASIPRLVHATNAAREYKAIQIDGSIRVRKSRPQEAADILCGKPGVEVLRAAATSSDEAAMPRAVAQLLSRVPADAISAHVVHPYIRSRMNEITMILARVLADSQEAALGPPRFGRPPRVTASRRFQSP